MKRILTFVLGALCILIIPTLSELFNVGGFVWTLSDYMVAAALLASFGTSVAYATGPRTRTQRVIGAVIVLLIFAIYVHLAVGIVDTWPLAGS